jgi:glycolate oxidase
MALSKEVYQALESVVGTDYISEDPGVINSYEPLRQLVEDPVGYIYEAVVLPGNTQEVQAIVRLCNRYKIQYKASSTGWLYSDPFQPGVIKLDLRRMDRIIEINEKNMYAVVEPHVIYAQLQAELMKRGLNCNITGAGSNCSALPMAAHVNLGHLSESGSYGERNLLAVEWVTPEGEIVRLGSLGSNAEWFCGDGPGPSLRGIIRGGTVPLGGLGVFTKAAQKVYHWPGPPAARITGSSPDYTPEPKLKWFRGRYIYFPDLGKMIDAVLKIGEAEIGFIVMGFNIAMLSANLTPSNEEDAVLYKKLVTETAGGPGFMIVLAGNSERDFEYKKRVLDKISAEYSGKSLKMIEDPEIEAALLWRLIRITASVREVGRAGGGSLGTVGGGDVFPMMARFIQVLSTMKADLIKRNLVLDETTNPFVQPIEWGHLGHGECLVRFYPLMPGTSKLEEELSVSNKIAIEEHFGVPQQVWNDKLHDMYGPHACNYHLWLRKIKKTFDPNAASESYHYITAKE